MFQAAFGCAPTIQRAVWYHGCRCLPGTTFEDGLLPNVQALSEIWHQLWKVIGKAVSSSSPEDLRSVFEAHTASMTGGGYHQRLMDSRQNGPWGKLVREDWFLEGSDSDHYLKSGPELVCFPLRHFSPDGELEKLYLKSTQACLVHFSAPCSDPQLLGHGLNFLRDTRFCEHPIEYVGYYGLESMEGKIVPFKDILNVEFLSPDCGYNENLT